MPAAASRPSAAQLRVLAFVAQSPTHARRASVVADEGSMRSVEALLRAGLLAHGAPEDRQCTYALTPAGAEALRAGAQQVAALRPTALLDYNPDAYTCMGLVGRWSVAVRAPDGRVLLEQQASWRQCMDAARRLGCTFATVRYTLRGREWKGRRG
jgi:hypothetical protein